MCRIGDRASPHGCACPLVIRWFSRYTAVSSKRAVNRERSRGPRGIGRCACGGRLLRPAGAAIHHEGKLRDNRLGVSRGRDTLSGSLWLWVHQEKRRVEGLPSDRIVHRGATADRRSEFEEGGRTDCLDVCVPGTAMFAFNPLLPGSGQWLRSSGGPAIVSPGPLPRFRPSVPTLHGRCVLRSFR